MINLDQIKLLETKVISIIEKAAKLGESNFILTQQNEELKTKLEANQNQIDELEMIVARFKEDQGKIEETILATLDKINRFGEMISKNLKKKPAGLKTHEKQVPLQESSVDEIDEIDSTSLDESSLDESSLDEPIIDESSIDELSIEDASDDLTIEDFITESEESEDNVELEIF